MYDVILDKENLQIKGSTKADFKISKDKFNNLKISYNSNYPLVGHEVETTEDGLILKIKKPFSINKKHPLKDITIMIDPGHGGVDSGACANGLKEKDINLEVSKRILRKTKPT